MFAALAFDSARSRMVLFGGLIPSGSGYASDTWEWDGTNWVERFPQASPFRGSSMAYDDARGRVVLVASSSSYQPETWEWDGVDWVRRVVSAQPAGPLVYDSLRGRLLSYGNRQTWSYAPTHPASYATFATGCAGSAGTPALTGLADQRPWLGDWFTLELTRLPPANSALVWLGRSRTTWGAVNLPFDLTFAGLPGCALRASPEFAFPVFNLTGRATLSLWLPQDGALLGAAFYNQALVADRSANALGATLSNGGLGRIGGR